MTRPPTVNSTPTTPRPPFSQRSPAQRRREGGRPAPARGAGVFEGPPEVYHARLPRVDALFHFAVPEKQAGAGRRNNQAAGH